MSKLDIKRIPGYEGQYGATADGRIYEYDTQKYLGFWYNERGYKVVQLKTSRHFPDYKNCKVHRLVALAWLPNPENKPEVDHIDENKQNCAVSNLRWVTSAENKANSPQSGRKIIRTKVRCVETGEVFKSMVQAAQFAGVHRYSINLVLLGHQQTAGGYHWERVYENK